MQQNTVVRTRITTDGTMIELYRDDNDRGDPSRKFPRKKTIARARWQS